MFQVPPPQKVLFPVLMQSANRQGNQLETLNTSHRSQEAGENDKGTISVMDHVKIADALSSIQDQHKGSTEQQSQQEDLDLQGSELQC